MHGERALVLKRTFGRMMTRPIVSKLLDNLRKYSYLTIVIVARFLLRIVAAVFMGNQIEITSRVYDQISYYHLALQLVDGNSSTYDELR